MQSVNITKYLKLPFQFDEIKLKQDLTSLEEMNWTPHFNKTDYDGEWNVISLYSNSGRETEIFALNPEDGKLLETPALRKSIYIKTVIKSFKTSILSARLMKLKAGAAIKPHRDHNLGYEDNQFRLHIPIITNKDVRFILDNVLLTMLPGECWYTNVNYVHSVKNLGSSDRVHLVIDANRNDWSDELFYSLAPKESFEPHKSTIDNPETILRMIEELGRSDTPAAIQLIKDLKTQLRRSQQEGQ